MASAVRSTPKNEPGGLELHPDDVAHLVLAAGEMMVRLQLAEKKPRGDTTVRMFDPPCPLPRAMTFVRLRRIPQPQ